MAQQLEEHGGVLVQGLQALENSYHRQSGRPFAVPKARAFWSPVTPKRRCAWCAITSFGVASLVCQFARKYLDTATTGERCRVDRERLSRADAGSLEMQAKKLESERLDLLEKLDEIRHQLTEARADEYRTSPLAENLGAGRCCSPSCAGKEAHGWIPGPVAAVAPLPLLQGSWPTSIARAFRFPAKMSMKLSGHLPELHDLPRPEDFRSQHQRAPQSSWDGGPRSTLRPMGFRCRAEHPGGNRNWPRL